jgi:NADH:ubiquinone oxidoreductase subunit F (NADH-binding)/NADH:ubiquinone oxidoreductase subunit E/NAD-dependent dihydropyrimidine dehydrogenase PreA subunit
MMLIRDLLAIQERHRYLPDKELRALVARTGSSLARIEELRTFFPHLRREPPPKVEIEICRDMTCHLRGASDLIAGLSYDLKWISALSSEAALPQQRTKQIIVAALEKRSRFDIFDRATRWLSKGRRPTPVEENLRFVIFDWDGKKVVHKKSEDLKDKSREIASLRNHLKTLSPGPGIAGNDKEQIITGNDKEQIIAAVTSIVGYDELAVHGVSCLGRCDRAPAVRINHKLDLKSQEDAQEVRIEHKLFLGRSLDELRCTVRALRSSKSPDADSDANNPGIDPSKWKIDIYGDAVSDFHVVRDCLQNTNVIGLLKEARLLGMGGAGVEAHQKWNDVKKAKGDVKYVVCNADESEPGTFKDREILLHKPHLVVEGIAIAACVVGAKQGDIYIREEYSEQAEKVKKAIEDFRKSGAAPTVRIEIFRSPGDYICGEQTALIEAMESRRAEPRNRPPELETNGLWNRPTLLNNVETLAWVPAIVEKGSDWYKTGVGGTERNGRIFLSSGSRFFSISGDVARPGVYEVPIGLTLREFIFDLAGGMRDGRTLTAVAPSGPSGGFLPPRISIAQPAEGYKAVAARFIRTQLQLPDEAELPAVFDLDVLDLELDLLLWRELGLMLGAGLVVYGGDVDMASQACNSLEFYARETCGKCVPCRIGTQKLLGLCDELTDSGTGPIRSAKLKKAVDQLATAMDQTSICGLGRVAPAPVTSYLKYFKTPSPRAPAATTPLSGPQVALGPIVEYVPTPIDEEPLFARDINDQLIRYDDPCVDQYKREVTLVIDGCRVKRPEAVPSTDDLGDILFDADGATIPRATTIYDAAVELVESQLRCDLRLMSAVKHVGDIPTEGKDLFIVADVDTLLHFRIFDSDGKIVVDIDEKRLTSQSAQMDDVRKRLVGLWPPHVPTSSDKRQIVTAVASIVGYTSQINRANPIPTLCHQPHLRPVAVCRVCVVLIGRRQKKDGKFYIQWQRKLLPACQHPVRDGMVVLTLEWNDQKEEDLREWLGAELGPAATQAQVQGHLKELRQRVDAMRESVTTLAELLIVDHIRTDRDFDESEFNELLSLGKRFNAAGTVFSPRPRMPQPERPRREKSRSLLLAVDHDACILCDRCIRGCSDVRQHHVIGRTGKGSETLIGFDLNVPMRESSCVECGECLISCPTSAITALRPVVPPPERRRRAKWARLMHDVRAIFLTDLQTAVEKVRRCKPALWFPPRS